MKKTITQSLKIASILAITSNVVLAAAPLPFPLPGDSGLAPDGNIHFISIIGQSTDDVNYNNDGAEGLGNIAIGAKASAITTALASSPMPALPGNLSVGFRAISTGAVNTSLGAFTNAHGYRNTAIGYAANVNIEPTPKEDFHPAGGGVAIGDQSYVSVSDGIAIGSLSNAQLSRTGETAYLSGEEIKENGVVSIGHKKGDLDNSFPDAPENFPKLFHSEDLRRQIINVAGGVDDYDAVNVLQLKTVNEKVDTMGDTINTMGDTINTINNDVNALKINMAGIDDKVNSSTATVAALAGLKPLQYDPHRRTQIMAAVGGYKGKHALALGLGHHFNESTLLHGGVTFGNSSSTAYNIGISAKIGRSDKNKVEQTYYDSYLEDQQDAYDHGPISFIKVLQKEIYQLKEQNKQIMKENQDIKKELQWQRQMLANTR